MKIQLTMSALLLGALTAAHAQVASHAPTTFNQAPAATSAKSDSISAGKPVARVNGSVLTEPDLIREEYTIFPYARQHSGIPKDLAPQIRDGALKMIIFEELVYQEALRRKMTVPVAKMQKAETDFRKQFATPDEFNTLLQTEFHGSQPLLREKIRRSILIESFLKSEVEDKGAVTPAEVRAYYDANATRFQHPDSYTFQTISILPSPKSNADQSKESRKRADDALHQAKTAKTADEFGLLAEKLSDDDYRVMMGQHKPVPSDQLAPQVLKAFQAMKPGQISDVIQIEQAFTIVRLQVHTPAGKTPFEEVKAELAKELQQNKTNQLRAALDKKLRQNAKIEEL
jgi:hypothetical protein